MKSLLQEATYREFNNILIKHFHYPLIQISKIRIIFDNSKLIAELSIFQLIKIFQKRVSIYFPGNGNFIQTIIITLTKNISTSFVYFDWSIVENVVIAVVASMHTVLIRVQTRLKIFFLQIFKSLFSNQSRDKPPSVTSASPPFFQNQNFRVCEPSTREFYKRVIYFAREPVYARTFIQKLQRIFPNELPS